MIQKPDHVHVVDAPDVFRGKFTGKTAARDYAEQVNQVLEENKGKVAAYIGWDCDLSCHNIVVLSNGSSRFARDLGNFHFYRQALRPL